MAPRFDLDGFRQCETEPPKPLDGDDAHSPEPSIYRHEGLAFEAAHFAQLVADGQQESPLITLDETIAIVETMEKALGQLP